MLTTFIAFAIGSRALNKSALRTRLLAICASAAAAAATLGPIHCRAQSKAPSNSKALMKKVPTTDGIASGQIDHFDRVTRELVLKTDDQQRLLRLQLRFGTKISLDGAPISTTAMPGLLKVSVQYDAATNTCTSIEAVSAATGDKNASSDARSRKTLSGAPAKLTRKWIRTYGSACLCQLKRRRF